MNLSSSFSNMASMGRDRGTTQNNLISAYNLTKLQKLFVFNEMEILAQ
jgi:hypothetical protein